MSPLSADFTTSSPSFTFCTKLSNAAFEACDMFLFGGRTLMRRVFLMLWMMRSSSASSLGGGVYVDGNFTIEGSTMSELRKW